MKKILFILMGFAIVGSVKAQEIPERKMEKPGMHHDMHKRDVKGRHDRMKMMKELNLTEEQIQQLKKNHEDLKARLEALKKRRQYHGKRIPYPDGSPEK